MARAKKVKIATSKGKAGAKRHAKKVARNARKKPRIVGAKAKPSLVPAITRDIVEEILVHSARAAEGEQLSDKALAQIAIAANLDPARLLEAHARLCKVVDEAEHATVFRVVELWEPYVDEGST